MIKGNVEISSIIGCMVDSDAKRKSHMSNSHMYSAAILARESEKCEKNEYKKYLMNGTNFSNELLNKHRACVTGAITLAIAFVESNINELFLEAVEGNKILFNELPPNFQDILSQLWDRVNRFSILDKYQLTLAVTPSKIQ